MGPSPDFYCVPCDVCFSELDANSAGEHDCTAHLANNPELCADCDKPIGGASYPSVLLRPGVRGNLCIGCHCTRFPRTNSKSTMDGADGE